MEHTLGGSGVVISRLTLGCMWSPALYRDERAIQRIVHAACDAGITSFDTAPLYELGRGEELLGRALRDRRQHVQILSKAGLRWQGNDAHGAVLFRFQDDQGRPRAVHRDARPAQLIADIEASLKRLAVDTIDLVQLHQPDEDTLAQDSLGALEQLRAQGKLRAIGVCNVSSTQLREAQNALATRGLDSLQCEYSLLERWPERELLPLCRAHGTALLAYAPLAKGLLSEGAPRLSERALLARTCIRRFRERHLLPLARQHGITPSQLALAFLWQQPGVSSLIAGASSIEQVQSNARALSVSLDQQALRQLAQSSSQLQRQLRACARLQRVPGLPKLEALVDRLPRS